MKHIFPLGLITFGVLLSLGTLRQLFLNSRTNSLENIAVPEQLAGLSMTASKHGAEAIAELTDLHGKEFPITSGALGIYGEGQITLWVAGVSSESVAVELTNAMQAKIAAGNSPFIPINEIDDASRKIYVLEGMGQKHYYFPSGNLVIWLAAEAAITDNALQQTLEVYP